MTSPRAGAIAVVQFAGPGVADVLHEVFRPDRGWSEQTDPARLMFGQVIDREETIDEGIAAIAGDGESCVAEVTVHGGVRIVERVLMAAERHGARVVHIDRGADPIRRPSNDTHSAFVQSGETVIDAEAAACLAVATTRRAVRFIARQRTMLPAALAEIAATIDADPTEGRNRLQQLIDRSRPVRYLLDGATVVLFGPVNAGKSTLINRLTERESSIVSPLPGTTRDWVDASTAIDGIPMRFIDTAGVRDDADERDDANELERDAIGRGLVRVAEADVSVVVLDGAARYPGDFVNQHAAAIAAPHAIVAFNKSDRPASWDVARVQPPGRPVVCVSGLTGDGIPKLVQAILSILSIAELDADAACLFTGRQIEWISQLLSGDIDRNAAEVLRAVLHRTGQVIQDVAGV
ncbi:MAG: GTP-binding protein [Phycisphaerales bacterium]|nr:GTP-binding protein [Phycisphaerales bacterium]